MQNDYQTLLDASIEHLERLKAQGTRFLLVEKETQHILSQRVAQNRNAIPTRKIEMPVRASVAGSVAKEKAVFAAPVEQPVIPKKIFASEDKEAAMQELEARAKVCVKCPHLAVSRKSVVFGVGDVHSPLMFVGEAPGADEDEQGEPFVGAAGQLLTRIIQTMGFSRSTIYIANILKCRPDTPGQSFGNRKPTVEEMNTCLPYLLEQIDIIQPKVIVALGATAVEGLFGKTIGITKLRGNWRSYRDIPVMPTYHPAYLLRNQAMSEKRRVWEDMLQVLEKLELPITEKQRGFFLKGS